MQPAHKRIDLADIANEMANGRAVSAAGRVIVDAPHCETSTRACVVERQIIRLHAHEQHAPASTGGHLGNERFEDVAARRQARDSAVTERAHRRAK